MRELARRAAGAAALALVAVGLALADGLWLAAALGLAAWALAGLARRPPPIRLEASRNVSPSFLEPGRGLSGLVRVEVEVRNLGARLELVELADRVPEGCEVAEGSPGWKGSLDRDGIASISYGLRAGRGLHEFSAVEALAVDPFLATESEAEIPCPGRVVAPPALLGGRRPAFSAPSARVFAGISKARRVGSGTDFAGTRPYASGDSLRDLNWRAQALWDQEIVNAHEEERALDAGVILDCRAQAYDRPELFEAAVSAAATLAEGLLDGGHRVAFLNYGSVIEWTPPGSGRAQRLRIRAAAAKASLGSHVAFERFDNVPVYLFPPRSLVLLASPLLPEDVGPLRELIALGYSVSVLRPDLLPPGETAPETLGDEASGPEADRLARRIALAERDLTASRLLRAGVEIRAWDGRSSLDRARLLGAGPAALRGARIPGASGERGRAS